MKCICYFLNIRNLFEIISYQKLSVLTYKKPYVNWKITFIVIDEQRRIIRFNDKFYTKNIIAKFYTKIL